MYQTLLSSANFFSLLLRIDQDLAQQARAGGCPWCGGVLHLASYRRKPRGGPVGLGPEHAERFSFCCSVEGCRRRVRPPSVRFLGRKVFFAVAVLLVPVLRDGPTPERLGRLEELFTVDRRTLGRWRRWWRESVPATGFWRAARGRFRRPVAADALPGSLLAAFRGEGGIAAQVLSTLAWLAPLTVGTALAGGVL